MNPLRTTLMLQRNAFTLLELVVSLASSMVLVAGLAGSLYISNQALLGSSNVRQSLAASTVLREMMTDLGEAKAISERTPNAITMTVPDRNGDLAHEVVRYAWSGTPGDPLTYQYNGGPIVNIATDVRAFNLNALTRELKVGSGPPPPEAEKVEFMGFTEKPVPNAGPVVIDKPPGTAEGDLLIACVATKGTSINTPTGWKLEQQIGSGKYNNTSIVRVRFGVWWKIAGTSEPSSYTWQPSQIAYGWIMRFTGHDSANPIDVFAKTDGPAASSTPTCPAVTTTIANAMILRLGGFDAKPTLTSPWLTGHDPIPLVIGNTTACSGAAGYMRQSTAGTSGTSSFALTPAKEYVTVTIAIAPKPAE